jgi:hypothetical protein
MSDFFILNQPPDPVENPYWLKSQGIAALQQLVGDVWSLYNDVDPGVTLLEHLCWALSEIGYCASFPLEDLLAGPDGRLAVPDQFPAQIDILSHQPVSADDYAKGLYDSLTGVRAVQILSERDGGGHPTGRQICYLAAQPDLDDSAARQLQQSAWRYLQRWRLPGHGVLSPRWLTPRTLTLTATLLLADAHQANAVADACALALDRLAAPVPQRGGYHTLREQGLDGAAIINGPRLERGWIPGPLPPLPASMRTSAIAALLSATPGVQAVLSLKLEADGQEVRHLTLAPHEIVVWALDLQFIADGRPCLHHQGPTNLAGVLAMQAAHAARGIGAGIDHGAPIPPGHFRNLADYHPVQLTLPPNWGLAGREVGRTEQQLAHARQLQGYLMPFEQLLTNQLAQLANLGHLFSPGPPPPPEKGDRPEDVPWQPLARSNFSQPLYQIPDVQDLISGQHMFDDWLGEPRPEESWQEVRRFSHNPYRHALATLTESEQAAVTNRLAMLRHLLARHGEDATVYDPMILAFQWYGSRERTLMIVHGLWLRNLAFLSHARCCAARYPAPPLLLPGDPALPESDPRFCARLSPQADPGGRGAGPPWWQRWRAWPDINGRPDLARMDALGTVDDKSLEGISSFEVKLGLLLDLPAYFGTLAASLARTLYTPGLREWLVAAGNPGARFHVPDADLFLMATGQGVELHEATGTEADAPSVPLLEITWAPPGDRTGWPESWHTLDEGVSFHPPVGAAQDGRYLTCHAYLLQLLWLATQRRGLLLVEPLLLVPEDQVPPRAARITAGLYWPNWIPQLVSHLPTHIETLRQRHWPSHVTLTAQGLSFAQLARLIPAFVGWHNMYGQPDADPAVLAQRARTLAALIPPGAGP